MGMRVGELARRTGVGVSTLRAWESRFGFLHPERSAAGHRLYSDADVERVDAVLRLVAGGLTLATAIARVTSSGAGALPDGEGEALFYGQILHAADQGVWVTKDGRTRYANRCMAEMMGYSIEELVAIPVLEFFEPAELPITRERTVQVRAGKRLHFTKQLRRADGSTFLAEITTTPLLDPAGRYDGAVALVDDITARHVAETQAKLRTALLDSVGEAVIATTPDGLIVYINRAAERLFGWRARDVISRPARQLFNDHDVYEDAGRLASTMNRGKRVSRRLDLYRGDGTPFVAEVIWGPALDDHDAVIARVAVVRDETEHARLARSVQTRQLQAETLALLGAQALQHRLDRRTAVPPIINEVVGATRRVLHADHANMLELIPGADMLQLRTASPPIDPPLDRPITVPAGSRSFPGYITLARKVVIVKNTAIDRRFEPCQTPDQPGAASAIGAPIFAPNGIIGVLMAESAVPENFSEDDAHFVQGMANIIGTALVD